MSTITTAPNASRAHTQRQPITAEQRAFLRAAIRLAELQDIWAALPGAPAEATPVARRTPAPTRLVRPAPATRRQPSTCPSERRYRHHRDNGEDCPTCVAFMRATWARKRAAHPEWQQRAHDNRLARQRAEAARRERAAGKPADVAARRAAVMDQFPKDAV